MSAETFDAAWLGLREPVDHRSRADLLLEPLVTAWRGRGWSRVLDLGAGTGSNLRYLAPRLPGLQRWTLVDHDPSLLAGAVPPDPAVFVTPMPGDLAREGLEAVGEADLVTASALLDLVSVDWLDRLVEACSRRRCGGLFALTYDGGIVWESIRSSSGPVPMARRASGDGEREPAQAGPAIPEAELDASIREAVNRHQRTDKGLGPALGPEAGRAAVARFREAGFRTWEAPSPWTLGPADRSLARELVQGWATAAGEILPDRLRDIEAWRQARLRAIGRGSLRVTVGHVDVLALPEGS